jgi:hypothetical protein
MKPRVYLETTIVSYLTAKPSRYKVMAGHQQTTKEWWGKRRNDFALYVSEIVLEEAAEGDEIAAGRRLDLMKNLPMLEVDDAVRTFARDLLKRVPLPIKAAADAVHIALAVLNGMNYLLTWNCRHIANATLRPKIEKYCNSRGLKAPIICTPEELLEDLSNVP